MDLLTANDRPGRYPPSLYAAQNARDLHQRPSLEEAVEADVCVVGGGFTGLSSAIHLAEKGFRVVVLEAQRVAFGASGRNGGQVGAGQRLDQDELEKLVGLAHAKELAGLAQEAVELVKSLAKRPEIDCPFHPGIIHAAHKASYVVDEHAYVEKLRTQYDYPHISSLTQAELQELIASPAYFGGSIDRASGHLDPLRYALGLARLAESLGVTIFEGARVKSIDNGAKVKLRTDSGSVTAEHVILGCNGYLGGLDKQVAAHVMPINNFIVATAPMTADEQEQIIKNNHAVADSKFVINYFRFSDDHRLVFGGTESYGYKFPADIAANVRKPLAQIFPQLAGVQIDYAWGGSLGITMNRMPHFARLTGNVLSMSGFSGHGIAMATLAGKLGAEAIAGQAERFDIMANVPTPRFPGGAKLRGPLLILGMLWFSLRDRL